MKNHGSKNSKYSDKQFENWQIIPIVLVISIIPLLVRARFYDTGLIQFPWYHDRNNGMGIELFLGIKQQALIAVAVLMLMVMGYYLLKATQANMAKYSDNFFKENGQWKWEPAFYFLLTYMGLALVSTVLSPNAIYGYRGAHEQFESLFVLLAYGIMVMYSFWAVSTEKRLRILEIGFLCGISALCGLGLLQITGNDLFRTTLGAKLILPKELFQSTGGRLSFTFPLHQVYLSLYNPNYVGMYVSLIIPVIVALFITNRNVKARIWYSLLIVGLLICLIGSNSKTAFMTLIFSTILLLVFFRQKLLHNKMFTVIGLGTATIFVVGVIVFMGNSFFERLKTALQISDNPEHVLSAIATEDDKLTLTYKGESAELLADKEAEGGFRLQSPDGQTIPAVYLEEYQAFKFQTGVFTEIPLLIIGQNETQTDLQWQIDGHPWNFIYRNNEFVYITAVGKEDQLPKNIEKGFFQNWESFATHRGYIWSRTFPLLKKYIFLGSGADTFTLVYPQNDYLGKLHNNFYNTIITKPHNLYLQMAVQTGVLSMLAIIIFYLLYFINSMRLYWKNNFDSYFSRVGGAVFIGTIGYMVSSIFNDSTITVAPIFWVLMGVGFAMNYQVKRQLMTADNKE